VGVCVCVWFFSVTSFFNTPVKYDFKFSSTSLVNSVIVNFLDAAPTKLCHTHMVDYEEGGNFHSCY